MNDQLSRRNLNGNYIRKTQSELDLLWNKIGNIRWDCNTYEFERSNESALEKKLL